MERGDATGYLVRLRIEGACSDLHAAEARYSFTRCHEMSSVELQEMYRNQGGNEGNRSRFITKLKDHMNEEIYVFSCLGVSSIIMMKQKVSSFVKVVSKKDYNDTDSSICVISKRIKDEVCNLHSSKEEYHVIDGDNLFDECSDTLKLSLNFEKTLPAVMIGNIITSVTTKQFTRLQLALSVIASNKTLIEHLHEYEITSTYDEFHRFKVSAAAATDASNHKEVDAKDGLIQIIADNFDAHIHSQNGLKKTHSMVSIIAQPAPKSELPKSSISRLKKDEVKTVKLKETTIEYFKWQKNPAMPESFSKYQVMSLKTLCHQAVSLKKAKVNDLTFILKSHASELTLWIQLQEFKRIWIFIKTKDQSNIPATHRSNTI